VRTARRAHGWPLALILIFLPTPVVTLKQDHSNSFALCSSPVSCASTCWCVCLRVCGGQPLRHLWQVRCARVLLVRPLVLFECASLSWTHLAWPAVRAVRAARRFLLAAGSFDLVVNL
jgi:hypothetical protein